MAFGHIRDQRDGKGQCRGCGRAPHHPVERQAAQQVHGDIEQAITRQRQAAERVVDRERKRSHRAAVDRLVDRVGRQQPVRRPQAADIRVLNDRVDVVVNEVAVEAVGVDEAAAISSNRGAERV